MFFSALDQVNGCKLYRSDRHPAEVTLPPDGERLLATLTPFRDGLVVGCE